MVSIKEKKNVDLEYLLVGYHATNLCNVMTIDDR